MNSLLDMKVVVMAGGKGTRIASVNSSLPKPMIPVCGKPILEWQLEGLKKQGLTQFIFIVGHLGSTITEYFGDGSQFGVSIEYIIEKEPLGTAGALFLLKEKITEDFLLINGDIIFDIDVERFYVRHIACGAVAKLFTHPNDHPYDSGIILADNNGKVTGWLHKEDERLWYKNRVNAGLHFLSPRIFEHFNELKKTDLDRDIIKPMIPQGTLYVYDSPEYVKDMGTPERYQAVSEDIASGKVAARNLRNPQKAVFLDRDGTLNEYVGFLTDINKFRLLPAAARMVREINRAGYLAIVVTNQPVIARGEMTLEELDLVHAKMETLLGQEGAYLDDIFYCPHHPDRGFEGERPEYKIECSCRKPKPGMLLDAALKYNIDLKLSHMVGDSDRDMQAAREAGIPEENLHRL